jgi:hypothetical protein
MIIHESWEGTVDRDGKTAGKNLVGKGMAKTVVRRNL